MKHYMTGICVSAHPSFLDISDAAEADGMKIHYGSDRQRWKRSAENFGYTKYSRRHGFRASKKSRNDGRPPDTGKSLLGQKKRAPEYEKLYRWKDNSCWLDSSLTLICAAAARDSSMGAMFSDIPPTHPLSNLRQMIWTRLETVSLPGYQEGGSTLLSGQRDGFRQALRDIPGSDIESLTDFQTMFVSLSV
jgi:hypothetical protein